MPPVSYQTIKLSKGQHASPEAGACVMELASMLAREPFTDHPASVCPVIGSFLRAYNDSVDDEHRQDLYAYAAKVVGSRARAQVERARADRLVSWRLEMLSKRLWPFIPPAVAGAICGMWRTPFESLGACAVHSISRHSDETHAAALALIDELLAIGRRDETVAFAVPSPLVSRAPRRAGVAGSSR